MNPEDRRVAHDAETRPGSGEPLGKSCHERLGPVLEHGPSFAIGHLLERRETGAHANRIRAERAGLIDRSGRRDKVHEVGAAAVGRHRKPAADHLAVADEIGNHAEHARGALRGRCESR